MRGLSGKVAVIAGGGTGIGAASARRLIEESAKVVIGDINIDAATTLAAELGPNAKAIHYDADDEASIAALIEGTVAAFGGIDILFNNAAITAPAFHAQDTTVVEIDRAIWDRAFSINVTSYLLASKYAIPHMIARGGGSIVNMASQSARMGDAVRIAYSMSKAAIVSLTLSTAVQYGEQGIRCNAVAPGLIETRQSTLAYLIEPHILVGRLGQADDIASMVAFLASEESSYVTGQVMACDGGLCSHSPHLVDLKRFEAEQGQRLKPMTTDQGPPVAKAAS